MTCTTNGPDTRSRAPPLGRNRGLRGPLQHRGRDTAALAVIAGEISTGKSFHPLVHRLASRRLGPLKASGSRQDCPSALEARSARRGRCHQRSMFMTSTTATAGTPLSLERMLRNSYNQSGRVIEPAGSRRLLPDRSLEQTQQLGGAAQLKEASSKAETQIPIRQASKTTNASRRFRTLKSLARESFFLVLFENG